MNQLTSVFGLLSFYKTEWPVLLPSYLLICDFIQSKQPLLLRSAAAWAAAASSEVHKQDADKHMVDVDWAEQSGAIRTIVYTTMHW